ncbi:hypothetical protein GH866_30885, partial [Bacillus thuringiensis]|nr:hypothetical protein [Bacillus thuringiensis]
VNLLIYGSLPLFQKLPNLSIQNATFKVSVEKLQSADDFVKMRKLLQNVVADDLMGMAVRNV